jgi:NADH dehydrogenase [ubiquinone] 1 alpha subcomplex assembly factor 7
MSAVEDHLFELIQSEGPISVAQYMAIASTDGPQSYYGAQDPFGASGDFTTSPEISQTFGELVGLWCAQTWLDQDRPHNPRLIELGPGRGVCMADALRAIRSAAPEFLEAATLHLVETSQRLRDKQREVIETPAEWHDRLVDIPDGPTFLFANEFFDALPIRQFVQTERGWCEQCVALTSDSKRLTFALSPDPLPNADIVPLDARHASQNEVIEICAAAGSITTTVAQRIRTRGGAALFVDYGYERPKTGDTLQAVKAHRFHPVLVDPGEADLSAHVNFQALAESARSERTATHGPVAQRMFLKRIGIEKRASNLMHGKNPEECDSIMAGIHRLTAEEEMGSLFKCLAITPIGVSPPGF